MKGHRTGVSAFASRTGPCTDQSFQKSFHLSYPDKIELKKISSLSENKKYATAQPNDRQKPLTGQLVTSPTQKAGFRVPKTVLWLIKH